jgi:viroplasmin and RNaseH domain-containing protein
MKSLNKISDIKEKVMKIKEVSERIPKSHFLLLRGKRTTNPELMKLLKRISCAPNNKMDTKNLAILFGVNIMKSDNDNDVSVDYQTIGNIAEVIINYHEEIFQNKEYDPNNHLKDDNSSKVIEKVDPIKVQNEEKLQEEEIKKIEENDDENFGSG